MLRNGTCIEFHGSQTVRFEMSSLDDVWELTQVLENVLEIVDSSNALIDILESDIIAEEEDLPPNLDDMIKVLRKIS